MFGWFKKAKTIIKPEWEQIEDYLKENAPDILEKYEVKHNYINGSCYELVHKTYEKMKHWTNEDTFGFRIRDVCGDCLNEYDFSDALGYLTKDSYLPKLYDSSWRDNIDKTIKIARDIAIDLDESFKKAREWFDLLNDNGLEGFSFSINFWYGDVSSVTLVPGNLKKYLDYVKPQFKDPMEYTEYEEYCYKEIKKEIGRGDILDAWGPQALIQVPKIWLQEKHKTEVEEADKEYIIANEKCKDILDKIKSVNLDK